MIILSVGPFNGQYEGENNVWLHIQMRTQAECMMAAQNVMTTAYIFQDLNPNLKVDAICRPNELTKKQVRIMEITNSCSVILTIDSV